MISNLGYPKRVDYFTHANDSFKRYLKLETLDGEKFDASGYSFDFVNMSGSQYPYRQSLYGIEAIETEDAVYIPIEYEEDVITREGKMENYLRATRNGSRLTWLTGSFVVSKTEDTDALETDVITIDTPTLKVMITILLEPPDGEVVEPDNTLWSEGENEIFLNTENELW